MSEPELVERAEREIIDAIEAQFDIHAMDPEDWAEMSVVIRHAIERLSRSDVTEDEVERVARALYEQGIVEREIAPAVARAAIAAMRSVQRATSADNPSPRQSGSS